MSEAWPFPLLMLCCCTNRRTNPPGGLPDSYELGPRNQALSHFETMRLGLVTGQAGEFLS
jgi:hypothetical protein